MDLPGEKLLIKLWETLAEKGIGGLLAPWQIRRLGRARVDVRREEMVVIAQAQVDVDDVIAGRKHLDAGGHLHPLLSAPAVIQLSAPAPEAMAAGSEAVPDTQVFITRASITFSARETKRYLNLQRLAIYAEEQADRTPDDRVSDEPIDDDWINRWRENAQDVSSEHMQRVWARILTEEMKSPGSYSVATLEYLRALSKAGAEKIAAIGPYALSSLFLFKDLDFFESKGLEFGALLELEEMGILSGVQVVVGNLEQYYFPIAHNNEFMVMVLGASRKRAVKGVRKAKDPRVTFPALVLTRRAREILTLGDYVADEGYLTLVGKHLVKQGFAVELGDWQDVDAKSGRLLNAKKVI